MRGLAGESSLSLKRLLQAIQQTVEGPIELPQFVVRLNCRQPAGQILGRRSPKQQRPCGGPD